MANPDRAYGFKPWGPLLAVKHLQKDAAAAAFGINDVVLQTTDGYVDVAGAAGTISNSVGVSLEYAATGSIGRVMCAIDPGQMLQAQDDGAGGAFAVTEIGTTGDSTFTTLNTTTNISTQFLLIDILVSDNVDGTTNALGANVDCVLNWAAHRRGSSTVGV